MISRVLISFILLCSLTGLSGQVLEPISWKFTFEHKGGDVFELVMTATVEEGWHLYDMNIGDGGPIPTSFTFDTLKGCSLSETVWSVTKPVVKHDKAFAMDIGMFEKSAEFRQKIVVSRFPAVIKGYVTFMACDDSRCLPPRDVEFEFTLQRSAVREPVAKPVEQAAIVQPVLSDSRNEIPPVKDEPANATEAGKEVPDTVEEAADQQSQWPLHDTTSDRATPEQTKREGLMKFLVISFLAGLAGVMTPCVFPMIPMTVAFFSGGSVSRKKAVLKALVFGLSIMIIYSSLGIIVSLTSAGAGFANTLSTHWIPNIIFFSLFIVFAASFLGAFEIILPSKWASSADTMVDKGGVIASFFLGLTTVIVSFSCTGPIVGALLVEAASGDVLRPTIGMAGFGFAFALPFTLFALSPSLMTKLPKSGGWLNSVKVVLGFVMLAFSMKFISTVDTVYNLNLISRDVFIAVWIVIFSLTGFYLLGKIKFSHDSDLPFIGTFRLLLVIATFTFVIYLIPGMFGAPLKGLSSLIPSAGKSEFSIPSIITTGNAGVLQTGNSSNLSGLCSEPLYGDIFTAPPGLTGYFDLEQALECARELGKPVLIDFKGHACANCKLMEANVWSDPAILERLSKNFVLVFLYTDDRTLLPEDKWVVSKTDGKVKKTIGKVNEDMEIASYGTNTIPLYVIIDHSGNTLGETMGANMNITEYAEWLDKGVRLFREGIAGTAN